MSRQDKIKKLANAVRAWRGAQSNGVWYRPPQQEALHRVLTWLERLNLATEENIAKLKAMAKYEQFDEWVKTI